MTCVNTGMQIVKSCGYMVWPLDKHATPPFWVKISFPSSFLQYACSSTSNLATECMTAGCDGPPQQQSGQRLHTAQVGQRLLQYQQWCDTSPHSWQDLSVLPATCAWQQPSWLLTHVYRFMSTDSRLLTHVYWLMSTDSCLLTDVYWFMSTDSCLLTHVYRLMSTDSCLLIHVCWRMSTDSCLLTHVYWFMSTYWLMSTDSCLLTHVYFPISAILCPLTHFYWLVSTMHVY